ncbi:unnamed protein product [Allacma fusca]|uniref:Uncharacterized protein n=1 Tax=Allacma fusca TaxID=39272 RepID=A0A8J2JR81_9HEXA|nr:unnamed protein product [Allacma fusca]
MRLKPSSMYECLHLDPNYMALTVQNLMTISESFHLLDIHKDELMNDLQTKIWMQHNTSLKFSQIVAIFELMDCNSTGFFDFDMYYFFTAIMLCIKDKKEKEFINRHARSLYNLFEVRMKGKMTHDQFAMTGWLFGFNNKIMKLFHKEFDISAYKRTVVEEFKFYILICIELQKMLDKAERVHAYKQYRKRLIRKLKPKLISYWKYDAS